MWSRSGWCPLRTRMFKRSSKISSQWARLFGGVLEAQVASTRVTIRLSDESLIGDAFPFCSFWPVVQNMCDVSLWCRMCCSLTDHRASWRGFASSHANIGLQFFYYVHVRMRQICLVSTLCRRSSQADVDLYASACVCMYMHYIFTCTCWLRYSNVLIYITL